MAPWVGHRILGVPYRVLGVPHRVFLPYLRELWSSLWEWGLTAWGGGTLIFEKNGGVGS